MPTYQFLPSDLSNLCRMDGRMNVDVKLTLDGTDKYNLFAEAYVIEAGKRAVVGDATGLGLVLTDKAEGTYTVDDDGLVTISVPTHNVVEVKTDTYSAQMKSFLKVGDHDEDGTYDSAEYPEVLDYVPETIFTLKGHAIDTYEKVEKEEEAPAEETPTEAPAAEEKKEAPASEEKQEENTEKTNSNDDGEPVVIPSDDGATEMTFNPGGSYRFYFAAYKVEDLGTYTYADGVLTLKDANGKETKAEGDPLKLTYAYSQSDQLTGQFTIEAALLNR